MELKEMEKTIEELKTGIAIFKKDIVKTPQSLRGIKRVIQ